MLMRHSYSKKCTKTLNHCCAQNENSTPHSYWKWNIHIFGYSRERRWRLSWFRKVKSDCLTFMTTTWCIIVKNTLGQSAVVSCECNLIILHETDFFVVLSGNSCACIWLCTFRKLNTEHMATDRKWRRLKTLIGSMYFLRELARTWGTSTHVVKAEVYLLRNNQYLYLVELTVTGITWRSDRMQTSWRQVIPF